MDIGEKGRRADIKKSKYDFHYGFWRSLWITYKCYREWRRFWNHF